MTDHYIDSLLGEREKIIHIARQHWFKLAGSIVLEILLIILFFIGTIVAVFNLSEIRQLQLSIALLVGFVLMLVPIFTMVRDIFHWTNRQYIVTNRRVIQISGVINKNVTDSSLEKVNDVKMVQSALGRIFDFGDIEILTASELGINVFKQIGKPIRFKQAMINSKERLDHFENGTSSENIASLIQQLDQLRLAGSLTEEEFQTKKAELLAKI
ncbi:MAG: hypothetical protein A2Z16_14930 [Chloroflexi bacterium RBG_16_54_18]|nr:MAG: hypothetical protein A2Z16_14930 [Chloroflexi bacterium RBG_16_54_18]